MKAILVALNARYSHSNLAVRALRAYACADARDPAIAAGDLAVYENHINQSPATLVRDLAMAGADLYGFSCYIWNIDLIDRVCRDLRVLRPQALILLGGPEVPDGAAGCAFLTRRPAVDLLLTGEGEASFYRLLRALQTAPQPASWSAEAIPGLIHRTNGGAKRYPPAPPLDLADLPFPYESGMESLRNRIVYYESSRGCPMGCAYCLSSIDRALRYRPLPRVLAEITRLAASGVHTIKFVDRTFNADLERAAAIWRHINGLETTSVFHFEVLAERMDHATWEILAAAPPRRIQLEIGIQSIHPDVLMSVNRKAKYEATAHWVARLLEIQSLDIHLDLIAGLPGESMGRFAQSFDATYRLGAHVLQVGILKILAGTQMAVIARERGYRYSELPPYRVFSTDAMTAEELYRIEEIARLVDVYHNRGAFGATLAVILSSHRSPFAFFHDLAAAWRRSGLFDRAISRDEAAAFLYHHMGKAAEVAAALRQDFARLADPREWARFQEREYVFLHENRGQS